MEHVENKIIFKKLLDNLEGKEDTGNCKKKH
jgi:hypothetical protein